MRNPFIRYRDEEQTVARIRKEVQHMLNVVCGSLPDPRADGARYVLMHLLDVELTGTGNRQGRHEP